MSGEDIISLAGEVLHVAELGTKISVKLYTFPRKVQNASKSIDGLSQDIGAHGAVLQQLGRAIQRDRSLKLCSQAAIETTTTLVRDTRHVFERLESLVENEEKSGSKRLRGTAVKQKLSLDLLEPKIQEVQANIERLKSSLLVVLNVLVLAEQYRNHEALPILREQRELIKILHAEKDANEKRYETILRAIAAKPEAHEYGTVNIAGNARVVLGNIQPAFTTPNDPACLTRGIECSSVPLDTDAEIATDETIAILRNSALDSNNDNIVVPYIDLPAGLKHHHECIHHHTELVQNLLREISSLRYSVNHGIRDRMHSGVLDMHWNEWTPQRNRHAHEHFEKIFANHVDVARHWTDKFYSENRITPVTPAYTNICAITQEQSAEFEFAKQHEVHEQAMKFPQDFVQASMDTQISPWVENDASWNIAFPQDPASWSSENVNFPEQKQYDPSQNHDDDRPHAFRVPEAEDSMLFGQESFDRAADGGTSLFNKIMPYPNSFQLHNAAPNFVMQERDESSSPQGDDECNTPSQTVVIQPQSSVSNDIHNSFRQNVNSASHTPNPHQQTSLILQKIVAETETGREDSYKSTRTKRVESPIIDASSDSRGESPTTFKPEQHFRHRKRRASSLHEGQTRATRRYSRTVETVDSFSKGDKRQVVQHQQHYLSPQQQEQYDHYQQSIIQAANYSTPTPLSGSLTAQRTGASMVQLSSSHGHSSSVNGPWKAEMNEILIEDNINRETTGHDGAVRQFPDTYGKRCEGNTSARDQRLREPEAGDSDSESWEDGALDDPRPHLSYPSSNLTVLKRSRRESVHSTSTSDSEKAIDVVDQLVLQLTTLHHSELGVGG